MLEDSNDYIQFLLLARAMADCDNKIGEQNSQAVPTRDLHVQCLVNRLKFKLSD
jgi:hypothetical protein